VLGGGNRLPEAPGLFRTPQNIYILLLANDSDATFGQAGIIHETPLFYTQNTANPIDL
jgi:hypothetical protein